MGITQMSHSLPSTPVAGSASAIVNRSLSLMVRNKHTGVVVESFMPTDNLSGVSKGRAIFDRTLNSDANQFVFDYSNEDLFERQAWVVTARKGSQTFGTGYAHFDETGALWIRAVAVDPKFSGNKTASVIGALAILHGRMSTSNKLMATCAIRILPGNILNEPSRVSFERIGLITSPINEVTYLKGSFRDRHLLAMAEIDCQGPHIRYRRMYSEEDVFEQSIAFLSHWSELHLPLTRKLGSN